MIVRDIKFIEVREFLRESIDLKVELIFATFYFLTNQVPINELTFLKRFFIGTGIGILNLGLLALVLRRDIQLFKKSLA